MNFDSYIITTFPGYFFQTVLCVKSLREHFDTTVPIYILIDDCDIDDWPTFKDDLQNLLTSKGIGYKLIFKNFSDYEHIKNCNVGWWRQQLVKCLIDFYVDGNEWLIVDADIIFNQHINLDSIPVNVDRHGQRHLDPISVGNQHYVSYFLGIDQNVIYADGMVASASAVPFRQLNRKLLKNLRYYVEAHINDDFVKHHIDLCNRQEIVGYDPTAKKMVMSEFELIECYRAYISDQPKPIRSTASAHTYCLTPSLDQPYRHSSLKDWQLGYDWLQAQGLITNDQYWQKSQEWIKNRPYIR